MERDFPRMKDKTRKPTEEEIIGFIGEQASKAWLEIRRFIQDHYDFAPEKVFYGEKYGWTVRFRKSGTTLCSLFPEKDGFTVLLVLGTKESDKALEMKGELSLKIHKLIKDTKQLHDGRWLWIRLLTVKDTDDVKKLLRTKRKPKEI
jgi:hypothetical protein